MFVEGCNNRPFPVIRRLCFDQVKRQKFPEKFRNAWEFSLILAKFHSVDKSRQLATFFFGAFVITT